MNPGTFSHQFLLKTFPVLVLAGAELRADGLATEAFAGDASFGWESRYFSRGRWFGDESIWMDLSLGGELGSRWSTRFNVFYADITDRSTVFSECQLGAVLSYDAGFAFLDVGLSHYRFFDGFGGKGATLPVLGNRDSTEVSFVLSKVLPGELSIHTMLVHDFRIDGSYAQLGFAKKWRLGERLRLGFSAQTGFSLSDYYAAGLGNGDESEGFTHSLVSLTLPFEVREGVSFTPHLAAHFSHEARESSNALGGREGTEFFWGATLSFEF